MCDVLDQALIRKKASGASSKPFPKKGFQDSWLPGSESGAPVNPR